MGTKTYQSYVQGPGFKGRLDPGQTLWPRARAKGQPRGESTCSAVRMRWI